MSFQELKECYKTIEELQNQLEKIEAENKKLREQLDFTKEYLNPVDTSFKQMIQDFKSLSKEGQIKLIDLSRAMKALSSEGERL